MLRGRVVPYRSHTPLPLRANPYNTRAWKLARASQLASEPYCVDHLKRGQYVLATVADHWPILERDGGTELVSRCGPCHSAKTARYDGGFGNPVHA